jgi:hypothetical protein
VPSRLQGRGRPWRPETRLHHMRCTTIQFRDFQSDSDDSSLPYSPFQPFPSTLLRSWLRPRELSPSFHCSPPTNAQNGRIDGTQFYHHCISTCLLNKTIGCSQSSHHKPRPCASSRYRQSRPQWRSVRCQSALPARLGVRAEKEYLRPATALLILLLS